MNPALLAAARERVERFDERFNAGELEVLDGEHTDKPVVRDSQTKRLVKGSGRYPNANDIAEISRETAVLRTRTHQKLMEALISVEDNDPDAVISLRGLVQQVVDAVIGGEETLKCKACGELAVYRRKVDTATGFKLIEKMTGRAAQTVEQKIEENTLAALLADRETRTEVFGISPGEAEERERMAREEGIVEAEWYETKEGDDDAEASEE